MEKVIERIIERIPEGVSLQIQTLSNEIFELNDQIGKTEELNHRLKRDLKDQEKTIIKLEREIIDLSRKLKRSQVDFNRAEHNSLHTKKRLEVALKIK